MPNSQEQIHTMITTIKLRNLLKMTELEFIKQFRVNVLKFQTPFSFNSLINVDYYG